MRITAFIAAAVVTVAALVLLVARLRGRLPAAPRRLRLGDAQAQLDRGIETTDPAGRRVRFGKRASAYLDGKRDGADRKTFLLWAVETVRLNLPQADEPDRLVYRQVFLDKGTQKGFIVFVDVRSGEVWDFLRKPVRVLQRATKRGSRPPG